jgi:hypothetical protein
MYYTEFYFKSDVISVEDRANFHLCCHVKYDIHCNQFHETALYRIPLQLERKMEATGIHVFMPQSMTCHCSNFHKAHTYLTTFVKTPTLNLIGHGQMYGHLKLRFFFYFVKNAQHWRKKDTKYHHHNDSNRIINASLHELNAKSPI